MTQFPEQNKTTVIDARDRGDDFTFDEIGIWVRDVLLEYGEDPTHIVLTPAQAKTVKDGLNKESAGDDPNADKDFLGLDIITVADKKKSEPKAKAKSEPKAKSKK